MLRRRVLWTVLAAGAWLVALQLPAQAALRDELGRTVKPRILVDKVLMASNKWVMTEDHIKEIADAGFNVVSPRLGNEDLAEVRRIAVLAQKHGICHLPWMRGTMVAKGPVKMVWANGTEQNLASPNSDELWQWMTNWIVSYAKLSTECPALFGVFLDYENYSPGGEGNCYGLSYDNKIWGEFFASRQAEAPKLEFKDRAPYLHANSLDKAFEAFQIAHWRQRCRALRQAVDAINPKFNFVVYPGPFTLFINQAILKEWPTPAAPLFMADPSNYGRPAGLMPHADALEADKQILLRNMALARSLGGPLVFLGGIDPVVKGADPEFSGRNAAMSAEVTDGYWVFYEGPVYEKDHPDYFYWFARANHAIETKSWKWAWRPRETPDLGDVATVVRKTDKPQLGVYDTRTILRDMVDADGKFEVHEFMGLSLEYLKKFDVVVLQNYNVPQSTDAPFARVLREYVEQGGAVMFAHDTAWFMDSPFPEVAVRAIPRHNVEADRHVVDTKLKVVADSPALAGLPVGTEFTTEFRDHMIFKPGPQGVTVIANTFGDPVYVLGQVGRGRVAFVGPYQGYQHPLSGAEKQAFLGVLDWLKAK